MPVGTPIRASACSVHHACTMSGSVLASLKPFGVSGRLSGPQGNTGMPLRASLRASVQKFFGFLLRRSARSCIFAMVSHSKLPGAFVARAFFVQGFTAYGILGFGVARRSHLW